MCVGISAGQIGITLAKIWISSHSKMFKVSPDKDRKTTIVKTIAISYVMPKPEGYPLDWFGEGQRLLSGKVQGDRKLTHILHAHKYSSNVRWSQQIVGEVIWATCFARRSLQVRISPTTLEEVIDI